MARVTQRPNRVEGDDAGWDAAQTARFLAAAAHSTHGPIWLVAVATGLRRGELLALRWLDVDEARGVLHVRQEVRVADGFPQIMSPLACASVRPVPIPADVVTALGEHRRRQCDQRRAAGTAWADHGLVFCRADGTLLTPSDLQRA